MNLKVTKNIQQLVAQRRAKKIETVRNEVITVNLKDARAKLAESTGAKQAESPTTPPPDDSQDGDLVADATFAAAKHIQPLVEKPEAAPQAPAPDTASLSPVDEDTTAPAPVDADVSSWKWVNPACSDCDPVDAGVSSGTGLESVDTADVSVKKPTRSRSRSKPKAKK